MKNDMTNCARLCRECADTCKQTMEHCAENGAEFADANQLQLLQDCIEICETSASFMERGSEHHSKICAVCADICNNVADVCDTFPEDHQMIICAEKSRECAEACRDMTGLIDRLTT